MDSLAVSIAAGVILERFNVRHAVRIAFFMGFSQALMPLMGWMFGVNFRHYIADYDHWIAFSILTLLGGKMAWNGLFPNKESDREPFNPCQLLTLLTLSLATSIDALAIGVSFVFLNIQVITPVLIIGGVTFLISLCGVYFGSRVGHKVDLKIELIGGVILSGIGLKILVEHLTKH